MRDSLRDYRVKYVILHRLMPTGIPAGSGELAALGQYLSTTAGLVAEHDEAAFTIYRNPEVTEQWIPRDAR